MENGSDFHLKILWMTLEAWRPIHSGEVESIRHMSYGSPVVVHVRISEVHLMSLMETWERSYLGRLEVEDIA